MLFFRRKSRGEEKSRINSENNSIPELRLKASTIDKLTEMKIDIERFSKKEIPSIEILERENSNFSYTEKK